MNGKETAKVFTDAALAADLRSASEELTIGDHKLTLSTFLWRDFMPISEENGKPLICVSKITDAHAISLSDSISLIKQYTINGSEIWIANYIEKKNPTPFISEGVVRNGPKWGPHIRVDIVTEFEYKGKLYRLLAKSQLIGRTD